MIFFLKVIDEVYEFPFCYDTFKNFFVAESIKTGLRSAPWPVNKILQTVKNFTSRGFCCIFRPLEAKTFPSSHSTSKSVQWFSFTFTDIFEIIFYIIKKIMTLILKELFLKRI